MREPSIDEILCEHCPEAACDADMHEPCIGDDDHMTVAVGARLFCASRVDAARETPAGSGKPGGQA